MSDETIRIDQKLENSPGSTMIGVVEKLELVYGDNAKIIQRYLKQTVDEYGSLRQRYIDLEGSAPKPLSAADDPFAHLRLVTPKLLLEGQAEPVPSVQDALKQHERMVMLGDPGAGKTTSLKVLLANAAQRCLDDAEAHPLPLLLELGAWPSDAPTLRAWVNRHLAVTLPHGSKLLLLLDGLNEIGGEGREGRIESICAYLREFSYARVVITCREKDYPKELDETFRLPKMIVAPLDDDKVRDLIRAYLPEAQAEALWTAIQPEDEWRSERALLELARNPYLLTLLAWIYCQNGSLPENPAQLFGQMVELRYSHEAAPPFTFQQFTRALGDLAFEMIDQGKGTSADKAWLRQQAGEQADALIRFGEACSVLVDGGGAARFFHQLMQEYFAAFALDWRGDLVRLARNCWRWRETLTTRLGIGAAAREQVIEVYIAALGDQDEDVRYYAAQALGKIGDARAVEPLIAALGDEDRDVRRAAAKALGEIKDACAVAPLITALGDEDESVLRYAAEALGAIGSAAVEPLIATLGDKVRDVRWAAAKALVEIGSAAVEPLSAALKDEKDDVRRDAVWALVEIGSAAVIEPLSAALGDEDKDVRRAAAWALGKIGDACAVGPLIAALGDEDKDVRGATAAALGKIGDARAVGPLITALGDEDRYVRRAAVEALGAIKDARAVEPLSAVLRDEVWIVRRAAEDALYQIGTPEALEALRAHGFEV